MQMFKEIETGLLANFSLLYITTREECRFIQAAEDFCVKYHRKLWIWTLSQGLRNIAFTEPGKLWSAPVQDKNLSGLRDPIALLEHLIKVRKYEGIFLLLDFHDFLQDALIRRLLRDLSQSFKESKNNIIILSPVLEIPRSLKHEMYVVDYPLPDLEQLSAALSTALESIQKRKLQIQLSERDREQMVSAGSGMTMEQYEGALAKAVVESRGRITSKAIDKIVHAKKQIVRESGLEFYEATETIDHVGGLGNLKRWLEKRQQAFTEKARTYGLPHPKGILLLGVQGCGKSLIARTCASLWKFPLLRLDLGSLFSSQVGSSEESTRRALSLVSVIAPAVLWIDEIEKGLSGLGSSNYSDAGVTARVVGTILTWLQEKSAPVFVIATANTVTNLPPELLRKGRFDEIFFLDLPDLDERKMIFRIHLEKRNRNHQDFNLQLLAESCPDYSGAEIEQAIIAGLYDAFDEGRPLADEDILRNLQNQVPLSMTMHEQIAALRKWAKTRARTASGDDVKEAMVQEQQKKWRNREIDALRPV
jgi:SpoVK/Ycf46/Vps4 family AAA+-type ATPase